MKLKIKLKNPKYCDGCPLSFTKEIAFDDEYGNRGLTKVCGLGYWTYYTKNGSVPSIKAGVYGDWDKEKDPYGFNAILKINRPKKCIKENGE